MKNAESRAGEATPPDLGAVRKFWEANPLYTGEAAHAVGSPEFFSTFDRVTLMEHSGTLHRVFVEDVRPGTPLLDVGCGIGFWAVQFARRGANVTACDLTENACRLTLKHAVLHQVAARVAVGNAEALPYASGSFAHLNCQGVIHHTPDMPACLREFHRVVRAGGTVCFSVYYRTLPLRWPPLYQVISRLAGLVMKLPGRGRESMFKASDPEDFVRMYDGAENPIGRAYTRAELRQMVGGMFEVLEEVRFGFPRRVLPISMPDWLHGMLARAFGLMIAFRCRRIDTPGAEAKI